MAVIARQSISVRENMVRLRALRQAEETRNQQAQLADGAPKIKKKPASKKSAST
ncbi:hypothetical protein [Bradyrhizobium sp.]|uniref:hypothetical protein n=1 Tax=Bradyrhizobium sp. TaxID=376 RepID=UPI003BC1BF95